MLASSSFKKLMVEEPAWEDPYCITPACSICTFARTVMLSTKAQTWHSNSEYMRMELLAPDSWHHKNELFVHGLVGSRLV